MKRLVKISILYILTLMSVQAAVPDPPPLDTPTPPTNNLKNTSSVTDDNQAASEKLEKEVATLKKNISEAQEKLEKSNRERKRLSRKVSALEQTQNQSVDQKNEIKELKAQIELLEKASAEDKSKQLVITEKLIEAEKEKNRLLAVIAKAKEERAEALVALQKQQTPPNFSNPVSSNSTAVSRQTIADSCVHGDNIHKAAARGNLDFVQHCLRAGVDVNVREGNNWTPLHSAARNGHLEIVKYLLENGAEVNSVDVTGRTPSDQAKYAQHTEILSLLIKQGGFISR